MLVSSEYRRRVLPSAADAGADGHKGAKSAAGLQHVLAHDGDEGPASHAMPEGRNATKEHACGEADPEAHESSHLHAVIAGATCLASSVAYGHGGVLQSTRLRA